LRNLSLLSFFLLLVSVQKALYYFGTSQASRTPAHLSIQTDYAALLSALSCISSHGPIKLAEEYVRILS